MKNMFNKKFHLATVSLFVLGMAAANANNPDSTVDVRSSPTDMNGSVNDENVMPLDRSMVQDRVRVRKSAARKMDKADRTNKTATKSSYSGVMKTIPHAAVSFETGSALLTESTKASLRKLVNDAEAKGKIDSVTVAAWSDKAFPGRDGELADTDRDLASARADAVENFLKSEMSVDDVDTYNMAEDSNWMARTFNTSDAELKSVFGRKGAETPVTNAEFQVIRNEGGPSTAVAVVQHELKRK